MMKKNRVTLRQIAFCSGDSVMANPFHALYNALADASNALGDVSDEYDTLDTLAFRESIDKHIDEALGDIRSWKEAIEGEL